MLSDEMRAEGWLPHDDGPCPVALNSHPEVMFRDGIVSRLRLDRVDLSPCWQHWQHPDDIIAYKPEKTDG